jgi:xanthine dehydrogenase YagT iron-sulfur-binding subunit
MTINRREFIQGAGLVAGVAAAGVPDPIPADARDLTVARVQVTVVVNGQPRGMAVEPRTMLLDALREHLHLTGTKKACDRGECGACTVLVEGRRVLSCMSLAAMQEGKRITTIEGLQRDGKLHPLQAAYRRPSSSTTGSSAGSALRVRSCPGSG